MEEEVKPIESPVETTPEEEKKEEVTSTEESA